MLYEFSGYSFRGSEACSFATGADLVIQKDCIANAVMPLERYNGYLSRRLDGPLQFSGTYACSGCCGNGWIAVGFNNGCGDNLYATYEVKRPLAPGAATDVVGRLFRCEQFYRTTQPTGTFYRVARADVHCDDSSGSFSYPYADYYSTLAECISGISGAGSPTMSGAGGCGSLSGGSTCCLYSDNGQSGYEFRSRAVSVSGKCCTIATQNGAWINSGTGAQCCPNQN